jgi:hypothetical protein
MKTRPKTRDVLWMAAGAAIVVVLFLLGLHFRPDVSRDLAFKARRIDLVGRMQVGLTSAAEAEKSAVLAISDQQSQTFAEQARAATAEVEREHKELGDILATGGTQAFGKLQSIDAEVLSLAVQNTNLKAFGLLFGPEADALAEADAALARVIAKHSDSPDAKKVMVLGFGARVGVLRVQTLLAPHIAEASDVKMDRLEAMMADEETRIRSDLDGLAALPGVAGDVDLSTAVSGFARYIDIKARILALSRENTNVRSLALSLNQKRSAMILCLNALKTLQDAIFDEPIDHVSYDRHSRPVR